MKKEIKQVIKRVLLSFRAAIEWIMVNSVSNIALVVKVVFGRSLIEKAVAEDCTNTDDKFFVNKDGSLSINPNSKAVQKAFRDNIEKMHSAHKGKDECGQQ
ncbi:TPA: hypothetical protein U2I32_003647 [Providencia rettgeri]|nr:hypothetical protein [Providencia rettgeri]